MLDLTHIFSINYLFDLSPEPLLPVFFKILVSFFGTLVVLGFVASKLIKQNTYAPVKKFFTKLYSFFLTLGILGLLYIFFRQQNVYFLSAPVWLLVWSIGALVWLGFVLKYYFSDRPEKMKLIDAESDKKKYLPHS
jgi:hypothetical protein